MKNETQNTPRQAVILKILRLGPQKRLILTNNLVQNGHSLTRITLIRELNYLKSTGLITIIGTGKATTYQLADYNPALKDPNPNFITTKPITYQSNVITHLHHLFTNNELSQFAKITRRLSDIKKILPSDIIRREFERFCIEFAWKSSAIEGNTYSLLETEVLLKSLQAQTGHTHHETQMILNHKSAFDIILANPPKPNELNSSYIRELHHVLVSNLDVNTGFRHHPVGISGSSYVPLDNEWQIREAIDAMIIAINHAPDPFTQALIAVSMISYIQPFSDGNKRTARMLGNAIILSHDLLPLSYRTVDEKDYKSALIILYEQNTLLPFKQLFVDQIIFAHNTYFRTKTNTLIANYGK